MVKHSKTAVQWAWWDDSKWVPYNQKTNLFLENSFQDGEKRIKADAVRFVDVDFKNIAAIRKQVHHDDDELIGLQRRYDDESRRRAVRRHVPELFDCEVFYVTKTAASDELIDNIQLYCGLIRKKFVKSKVTGIIVDKADVNATLLKTLKVAKEQHIDIMSADYIDAVIQSSIDGKSMPSKLDFECGQKLLKRKADDNDDDDDDESVDTSKPAKKKSKTTASKKEDMRGLIQKGTTFEGSVVYTDGDKYPFKLVIDEVDKKYFKSNIANVTWSSLKNAETQWKIKLSEDGSFEAKETGALNPNAKAAIAIGTTYRGKINNKGDILKASFVDADLEGRKLAAHWTMVATKKLGKVNSNLSGASDDAKSSAMVVDKANDDDDDDKTEEEEEEKEEKQKDVKKTSIKKVAKKIKGVVHLALPFELDVANNEFFWLGSAHEDVDAHVSATSINIRKKSGGYSLPLPIKTVTLEADLNPDGTFEHGQLDDTHCSLKLEGNVEF